MLFMRSCKLSDIFVLQMERMPCPLESETFPNANLTEMFFQIRMHVMLSSYVFA